MTFKTILAKIEKFRDQSRIEKLVRRNEPIPFEYGGRTYHLNPDRASVYHIQNSTKKIQRMIRLADRESKTCFDVGANCGIFSGLLAKELPEIEIHAFEPSSELHSLIDLNCQDANLKIYRGAVGDSEGEVTFFVNPNSQQTNSCNFEAVAMVSEEESIEKRTVPVTTLDSYRSKEAIGKVDILKIDVQGFEGAVFRGAKSLLPSVRQVFLESTWMDIESIVNVVPLAKEYGFSHLSVINPVFMGVDLLLSRQPPSISSFVESSYHLDKIEALSKWT